VALFQGVQLPNGIRKLVQPRQTPTQLLDLLLLDDQLTNAITFLAQALPGREALVWSCLAIEELAGETMPRPERLVFNQCIRWVMHPVSSLPPRAAEFDAALQATAVDGLSEAIIAGNARVEAEQNQKPIGPDTGPLPRLVTTTINRLTFAAGHEEIVPRQRCVIAIGIGVARGIYRFAK
jgi:hypothetical protein